MPHQPQQSARVTFGPFEVDASTGELFKSGVRIRLTGQPFRILILLLDHAGEILTREKLREQIWGEGTFVDFEHSLNVAINKLRRTLNDSAETPRYIETLSGRGYRFIGSIEETVKPNGMAAGPAAKPVITDDASTSAAALPVKAYPMATHRWGIGAALLAFVTIAGAAWFHFRPVPMFTEKDTIVLADFRNSTDDPVFEGTLRHGLAVELQESPFISLTSDERVHKVLDLMLQPADARLTPELAREVCERTGSAAVLDGSIARMGSRYVLGLQAKNCRTGDVLDDQQVQAANKEDVLGAVARMAARFRKRAGESLATIKQHSTPLSEATTPSLDAWKAFTTGWNVLTSKGHAAALPWFERATRIDPEFAAAYAWRGRMYSAVGQGALQRRAPGKHGNCAIARAIMNGFTLISRITGLSLEIWSRRFVCVSSGFRHTPATRCRTDSLPRAQPRQSGNSTKRPRRRRRPLNSIPIIQWPMPISPTPIASVTSWKRRSARFSVELTANWHRPIFSLPGSTSPS